MKPFKLNTRKSSHPQGQREEQKESTNIQPRDGTQDRILYNQVKPDYYQVKIYKTNSQLHMNEHM
jgi:hypothetical protein